MYYLAKKISSFFSCSVIGIYLAIRTGVCMILSLILTFLVGSDLGKSADFCTLFCIAVMFDIAFGFFGGIFFLMKQ